MYQHRTFDFCREVVFASADDHLLDGAGDPHVTPLVRHAKIAGMQAPLRINCCCFRIAVIFQHHTRTARTYFPLFFEIGTTVVGEPPDGDFGLGKRLTVRCADIFDTVVEMMLRDDGAMFDLLTEGGKRVGPSMTSTMPYPIGEEAGSRANGCKAAISPSLISTR